MINKIIHLSDVHLKHKFATKESFDFMCESLISEIDSSTLVVITGDLLHQRVSLDSDAASQVMYLFNLLNSLNITTIVLKGTRSHDYDYLESIDASIFNNMIFATTVGELVVDNLKILAVPEEYMEDQIDYYADTIYDKEAFYDLVLFHGTISDVASYNEQIEHVPFKKAPSFKKSEFFSISNIVLCGHIHKHQVYRDKENRYLSYAGSWNRLCHGEEEVKSLQILNIYSNSDNSYFVKDYKEVENLRATKLVTVELTFNKLNGWSAHIENKSDSFRYMKLTTISDDFSELISLVKKAELQNHYIRFKLTESDKYPAVVKLLNKLDSNNKNVSLLLKGLSTHKIEISVEEKEKNTDFINAINACHDTIEEINLFIYTKHGFTLDRETIIEAVTQKI